ncbi:MAG: sugar-binding protein [Pseudomonadota bacterium]
MARWRLSALAIAAVVVSGAANAQRAPEERPELPALQIDKADAPRIDGDLDDPVWARATPSDAFRQVFPNENADPSERTEVRVVYDSNNVYFAVHAYDRTPSAVRATLLERDPPLQNDDAVRIILDPQLTGRDGYYFAVNPNGAREDGLLQNNGGFVGAWNAIWNARAKRTETGWVAEFKIPFRTIAFNPDADQWGFNVVRTIPRRNEEIRWSMIDRNRGRVDTGGIGRLTGIRARKTGLGVDARGFIAAGWSRDETTGDEDVTGEPSGDVFVRLTPSLNAVLTANTDFSDTPLDNRQVNTGRFSLFFPETRGFFLEDTAIFEFGGRVLGNPNGRPFFTRRIGLVDGQEVNLDGGLKIAGRAGKLDIGGLVVQTGARDIDDGALGRSRELDAQTLGAARVSARVFGDSKIGVVATYGDPRGLREASTLGVDVQLRNNSVFGKGVLQLDAAYVRSENEELSVEFNPATGEEEFVVGDPVSDDFYGFELAYPNDRWRWELRAKEWGENYDPALGFVNRRGFREFGAEYRRRWRPNKPLARNIDFGGWTTIVQDLEADPLEEFTGAFFEVVTDYGDGFFANAEYQRILITEPFTIANEIEIPARSYGWTDHVAEFWTTRQRRASLFAGGLCCEFYDGNRINWWTGFQLRPNRFLQLEGRYDQRFFDLPGGEAHIHIGSAEVRANLNPRLSANAEMQYDNISEQVGVLARVRWEPRPQTEVLLAVGHSAQADPDRFPREFQAEGTSVVLRFGNTFRL